MNSTIFVTATGTEIGKTYLCELIIKQAKILGHRINAIKPIISGLENTEMHKCDSAKMLKAQGIAVNKQNIDKISPWQYKAALAPSMAMQLEEKTFCFDSLINYCKKQTQPENLHLIEGVGGLMSPISSKYTCSEWISALNSSVVLVTGSYLGSISHTLCTLNTLKYHRISVQAIFLNETNTSSVNLYNTYKSLKDFCPTLPIYKLFYQDEHSNLKTVQKFLQNFKA